VSSSEGKVITKLHRRRQVEADLRRMVGAGSNLELERLARRIAARGPEVIPILVGSLDQADHSLVVALGMVADHLERGRVHEALVQVLQQPDRPYRARVAAVTILERYLGVAVGDDLRPSLAEATAEAVSSLAEVLDRAEKDRSVLAATVQSLDQQEPDVVLAVVGALRSMPDARPVHLLQMLAQDVREEIAAAAIQALGSLRLPEAARALQTLIPTAAPPLRPVAERLLRKLQFSGVAAEPLPPPSSDFRALVGPIEGQGRRLIWFIEDAPGSIPAQLLLLALDDHTGAVEAVQYQSVQKHSLPRRQPVGVWPFVRPGAAEQNLLEAPFDLGRRVVAEALVSNRETQIPLPGALRLVAGWLWGTEYSGHPAVLQPEPASGDEALLAESDRLLGHPAFAAWELDRHAALAAAGEAVRRPGWDREVWVRRLVANFLADQSKARRFRQRVLANGEWLQLAGQEPWARQALVTARMLAGEQPEQIPFVQALARRDLLLAMASTESYEPGEGSELSEGD
jgi:hypothetical protein